jgi:hypothetical protein
MRGQVRAIDVGCLGRDGSQDGHAERHCRDRLKNRSPTKLILRFDLVRHFFPRH